MNQRARFHRLLTTPEGLAFVALAWVGFLLALLALLSGPSRALGIARLLPITLSDDQRVGRVILLYHSLAIPFLASLVYLTMARMEIPPKIAQGVNPAITAGFLLTSIGGLTFGYLGRNWLFHGVYLVGLSLTYYAGVLLAIGLLPRKGSPERLTRWAFGLTAIALLISATIGGAIGAFFGNGFKAVLAEDIIRQEHDIFQRGVIAHLHIMLTLIDVAILLLVARITPMGRRPSRWVYGLTIVGTIIVSLATWSVIIGPLEKVAHKVINVGAAFLLPAGILVAAMGFRALAREGGLLRDPFRLGLYWFLIFVNVVVTVPGVYVAMNLETYRLPAYLEVERTIAVGHWHVLATLSAAMGFLLVAHARRSRTWAARASAWGMTLGTSTALVFIMPYMFRQPAVAVTWPEPLFEAGIGVAMLSLAAYLISEIIAFVRGWTIESTGSDTP
ncbi:MAG: hypothetical protein H5T65_00430 [Chloroflexi bacterium]|nr:hypothetical protein [Chloroflexota bacterium]